MAVRDPDAVRPHFQRDDRRALRMAPVQYRVGLLPSGKLGALVQVRQEPVAKRHRGDDDRAGARQRPKLRTHVAIERDLRTGCARGVDRREHRIARAGADRLTDARHVQHFGRSNNRQRQVRWPHPTRGRTGAKVAELVAAGPVGDEVDAGIRVGIDRHAAAVDALAIPQREELAAESIVTEPRDVTGRGTESRGGNDTVRSVASETLQIFVACAAGLVEFEQRFAQRHQVEARCAHR